MSKNHWGVRNENRNTSSDEHCKMGQRRLRELMPLILWNPFNPFYRIPA